MPKIKKLMEVAAEFAAKARRRKNRIFNAAIRTAIEFAQTPRTITDVRSGTVYRVVPDKDAQKIVRDLRKLGEMI